MKNRYEIRGDVFVIFIRWKDRLLECLVDVADAKKVNSHKNTWFARWSDNTQSFYVISKSYGALGKEIKLHRYLMGNPSGMEVDHINHNTLDNRVSCNLRAATKHQNQQNRRGATKISKSQVRGVSWKKDRGAWRSTIIINRKQIHLGYFDDIKEAEMVVQKARSKLMPFSKEGMARKID